MYITVNEVAEMLSVTPEYVEKLIRQKKIRGIFDGEQYVVYKEQFNTHLVQLEKYLKLVEEIQSEPLPEDIDVKDED